MRKKAIALICALAVLGCWTALAWGLMLLMSVGDLTSQAQYVVSGRVAAVQSSWSKDGRSIVTQAVLEVEEAYKGGLTRQNVVVEYLGGEVGDIGMGVSDMPAMQENEQVIVFLQGVTAQAELGSQIKSLLPEQGQGATVLGIVGQAQGKYSLSAGTASKSGYATLGGSGAAATLSTDELINLIKLEVGNESGK